MPYTYLIGWDYLDLWYYGFRGAKNCSPDELLVTYLTSSATVHKLIVEHGLPTIMEIRKTFTTMDAAYKWETKVLRRLGVSKSKKWINRHENYPCSPFGSEQYKNMLIKERGVSNANQLESVRTKVSNKLSGRMAAYNKDTKLVEYINKELYQNNKQKYLHTSSYAYREEIGVFSKQTKNFENQPKKSSYYDKHTGLVVKLTTEERNTNHISINSKEYLEITGKSRKPNTSLHGKEYVIDLHTKEQLHIDTSFRKADPLRYTHINSAMGKSIRKNGLRHKTLCEPLDLS